MPLCQSTEVKGLCEGRQFMYLFCSPCSLVAAVCHVYREGDCNYIGASFSWDDPAVLLSWLTHCSVLLISTSIIAQYLQHIWVARQHYTTIEKPQSLRWRPWILLLCGFHHYISAIYFITLLKVNNFPNKSLLVKTTWINNLKEIIVNFSPVYLHLWVSWTVHLLFLW